MLKCLKLRITCRSTIVIIANVQILEFKPNKILKYSTNVIAIRLQSKTIFHMATTIIYYRPNLKTASLAKKKKKTLCYLQSKNNFHLKTEAHPFQSFQWTRNDFLVRKPKLKRELHTLILMQCALNQLIINQPAILGSKTICMRLYISSRLDFVATLTTRSKQRHNTELLTKKKSIFLPPLLWKRYSSRNQTSDL